MRPGEFLINGKSSIDEYGTRLQSRFDLETPIRRGELVRAIGQDGYSIIDEEAYDDTKLELVVYIEPVRNKSRSDMRNLITSAFTGSGGYIPFVPYLDEGKIYFIRLDGGSSIVFRNKYMYGDSMEATIPIMIKPWKELVNQKMTEGTSWVNPTLYDSKPLIRITMTANTGKFVVNGVTYNIVNAGSSEVLYIDCQRYIAYNEVNNVITRLRNNTLTFKQFPIFKADSTNTISGLSGISKFEAMPRWRELV